jgi:hypothetical protein
VAADEEGEEPEQMEEEGDHEPRLWPDAANRSITCRADNLLAKDRRSVVRSLGRGAVRLYTAPRRHGGERRRAGEAVEAGGVGG